MRKLGTLSKNTLFKKHTFQKTHFSKNTLSKNTEKNLPVAANDASDIYHFLKTPDLRHCEECDHHHCEECRMKCVVAGVCCNLVPSFNTDNLTYQK